MNNMLKVRNSQVYSHLKDYISDENSDFGDEKMSGFKLVYPAKVIMNNNGVLEKEVYSETYSQMIQRYWINL